MWQLRLRHAGIYGGTVVTLGSVALARCACGVTNSGRYREEIESWAVLHDNYVHELEIADLITDPDGLSTARRFFGLVKTSKRAEAAFGNLLSGGVAREAAERLLAWCESALVADNGADEEWLGWLAHLTNRLLAE